MLRGQEHAPRPDNPSKISHKFRSADDSAMNIATGASVVSFMIPQSQELRLRTSTHGIHELQMAVDERTVRTRSAASSGNAAVFNHEESPSRGDCGSLETSNNGTSWASRITCTSKSIA